MDNEIKEVLLQLMETSSDEDDDFNDHFLGAQSSSDSSFEDENHAKVNNFMDTIAEYSADDFKSHFRLNRLTAEHLITNYSLSEFIPSMRHGGRPKIGAAKEVYMYVWYVSNTITFRQLGNLFGVSNSSAWIAVGRVSNWLTRKAGHYIKWPQGEIIAENCRKFEAKKQLPGIIGAIDCTHVTIAAPKLNKECYYNRKQHFTVVMQAVVDADKKFIDICVGEPGSLHDCRVLRRSALYRRVQTNYDRLFPCNTFLIGDSAYPVTNWLVPPYKDYGRLTDQQRAFNYVHSATRMVVENAFGLLKGRFRRLNKFTEQRSLQSINKIIVSACILHNICIDANDHYVLTDPIVHPFLPDEDNNDNDLANNLAQVNRRQMLFDYLCQQNII